VSHSVMLRFRALWSSDSGVRKVHVWVHPARVRRTGRFWVRILGYGCGTRRREAVRHGRSPADRCHVWATGNTVRSGIAVCWWFERLRRAVAARMRCCRRTRMGQGAVTGKGRRWS
jgi:hypothetical protein